MKRANRLSLLTIMAEAFLAIMLITACADTFEYDPPEPERAGNNGGESNGPKSNETCDREDKGIYSKNSRFTSTFRSCAWDANGESAPTVRCIRQRGYRGLRSSCGGCFGQFAACGKVHCKAACLWSKGTSANCIKCGQDNCGKAWERCTGSSMKELAD